MHQLNPFRLFAALLLLLATHAGAQPADCATGQPVDWADIDPADHAYDDWYLDTIDGQPSGYWRAWMTVEDGRILSGYEEIGVESHGGELLHTRTSVRWTETTDYKPITIVVENASGGDTVKQTYRFTDGGIELTSEQNGRSIERTLPPIEDDYLTAAQSAIALEHLIKRGDTTIELNTLDPLVGMQPYVTGLKKADEKAQRFKLADGSGVDATEWAVTYSIVPGFEGVSYIDEDAREVGLSFDIGGVTFLSRLADESVTQTEFDPPEMAGMSVVVPDKPIEDVLRQKKLVYELHYDAGESKIGPINTTHQSVEQLGPGRVRVTVDLEAANAVKKDDKPTDANLAASIMVDHEDEAVRALAEKAVRGLDDERTAMQVANACKRRVSRHVTGVTLAVGDATASETARSRQGDCTECSVLLAAMLRAHGIPSRCVTGLAYGEDEFAGQANAFVYHMWTQAWIEDEDGKGRWVDLDAALWRYTAGHIALGVSDMGDDDQADLIKLIPMMQGLEIKVIDD